MILAALDHFQMGMGLFGGLAIFLFGMDQMTATLKAVAGDGMKRILARLTTNRFKAVGAGAFVTAVIQSSSVTTVLVVGFVSAGLMTLQQSIGMIMGAEIGTTITAQIIAFKVTSYALVPVAIGFGLQFFSRKERVRQWGLMLFGFGLIFFGMYLMGEAMKPLRSHQPFIDLMREMDNPLLAILVSAGFTGLVQSSSATTAVIIMLAKSGFISLEGGIALAFGANIGTCVTALLASIGKPRVAVQAAMVHLTFNVAGVLLWVGFIDQLAAFVSFVSPMHADLTDKAQRLMAETPRQIANAHTTFNVANTLIFIWFTKPIAAFVQRIVPLEAEPEIPVGLQPKYLDDNLISTPSLALDRIRLELARMGRRAVIMIRRAPGVVLGGTTGDLQALKQADDDIDALHGAVISYLGRVSGGEVTEKQTEVIHDQFAIANYIENMADIVETNLITTGRHRVARGIQVSEETLGVLSRLIERVTWAAEHAIEAVAKGDAKMAGEVIAAKDEVSRLADGTYQHLIRRVGARGPEGVPAYQIEAEIVESLKRVYYHAKRIAKVVQHVDMEFLQAEGELIGTP
jgi:phosphate:Na+ symporter